jgi:hypothetical protein
MSAIHDSEIGSEMDPTDEYLEGPPISIEDQARAMGWKPPGEFRGDPRHQMSAEDFVKKGMEELPVLRDQNFRLSTKVTRMSEQLETMRRTSAEQAQAVKEALRLARGASKAGYERAKRELKGKQRLAAEQGDMVAFDQLGAEIDAMEVERTQAAAEEAPETPAAAPPTPAPAQGGIDPAVLAFTRDPINRWFFDAKRPHLKQGIINFHSAVIAERELTDVAEQLEEAKRRLVEMYPQDFQPAPGMDDEFEEEPPVPERRPAVPAPRRAASVAAPSRAPIAPGGARQRSPFDVIEDPAERAEAHSTYQRLRGQDPGLTAAEYMEIYTNPKADALELRRRRKP